MFGLSYSKNEDGRVQIVLGMESPNKYLSKSGNKMSSSLFVFALFRAFSKGGQDQVGNGSVKWQVKMP